MSRKVFLSFLGTGNYTECCYDNYGPVKFIQTALINNKCAGFDKYFIVTTETARKKNMQKLKDELEKNFPIYPLLIPNGGNEDELWEIFNVVFKAIEPNDEIVCDVTHSFRSLPIIIVMLLQYLKVLKNVSLSGLFYGAFEALGARSEVEEIPPEERLAPVFDLTPFVSVYDWARAVENFMSFGNAGLMEILIYNDISPVLKETKGADINASKIRDISKVLSSFTKAASTCRGKEICDIIKYSETIEKIDFLEKSFIPPLEPILEKIKSMLSEFKKNNTYNGIKAARWCADHGMIQQGYTLLQESIITYLGDFFNAGIKDEKERRKFVSSFLNYGNEPRKDWQYELKKYKKIAVHFLENQKLPEPLFELYKNISNYRNDINHAGFLENRISHKKLENDLDRYINEAEEILKNINTSVINTNK